MKRKFAINVLQSEQMHLSVFQFLMRLLKTSKLQDSCISLGNVCQSLLSMHRIVSMPKAVVFALGIRILVSSHIDATGLRLYQSSENSPF